MEQLHAHSQWLQNEWDAAKIKIDELNHSSHHWWTVADGLSHELQSVYHSKLWRMTWPLRKLMQLTKWLLWLPVKIIVALASAARWFVRGSLAWLTLKPGSRPRRTVRLLLLHARNWVYARPLIKVKILSILHNFPKANAWLRRLHYANPIQVLQPTDGFNSDDRLVEAANHGITVEHSIPDDAISQLTPRARQIYRQLKSAIANTNKREDL